MHRRILMYIDEYVEKVMRRLKGEVKSSIYRRIEKRERELLRLVYQLANYVKARGMVGGC